MHLITAQKLMCDFGYENIDKLIKDSIEKSFNLENHKFGVFQLFEGYKSINKISIHSYKDDPIAMFVYAPNSKVVTIDNLDNYLVSNIIASNVDIKAIINTGDELLARRIKEDLECMLNEYIATSDMIKEEIFKHINNNIINI